MQDQQFHYLNLSTRILRIFISFFIKYFDIFRVVPRPNIPQRSYQDEHASSDVEWIFDNVVVVQPAVALLRARFAPQKARSIEDVAEEDWTRNDSKKFYDRRSESYRDGLVSLLYTPNAHEKVGRSFGSTDELVNAHDREKNVKVVETVDGARTRRRWSQFMLWTYETYRFW